MSQSNWGGKRDGAGSGGKREGAGRPRRKWDSGGRGGKWIVEKSAPNGFPELMGVWTVLDVGDDYIDFQNEKTEEIITIRKD
jgi:hypothetical protein